MYFSTAATTWAARDFLYAPSHRQNSTCHSSLGMRCSAVVEHLLMVRWVIGSIFHGRAIELFHIPASAPWPVYQRLWYMYVFGMVRIKTLIEKSTPCSGGSGFPLWLSEWSFNMCPMPYNCMQNVLSALLNKTFPSISLSLSLYVSLSLSLFLSLSLSFSLSPSLFLFYIHIYIYSCCYIYKKKLHMVKWFLINYLLCP